MNRRYTPEMDAWLRKRYQEATNSELASEFEKTFGQPISVIQLYSWASSRGIRKLSRFEWTDEMNRFMQEFIPGHTEAEIREAFLSRFGIELTESQIGNAKTRLGVKSGTTGGRFEKGMVPKNKGRSWDEQGLPPETRERMMSTCFKAGNEPANARRIPVGSERLSKEGYVEVKVRTMSPVPCTNRCWRPKHHLVWEEANGQPVPEGAVIAFADGDKRNIDPENLVAVPRRLWAIINHMGITYADRETLLAAMSIAEAKSSLYGERMRPRKCGACGDTFQPAFKKQRTCPACLEAGIRAPRAKRGA